MWTYCLFKTYKVNYKCVVIHICEINMCNLRPSNISGKISDIVPAYIESHEFIKTLTNNCIRY